MAKYLLYTAFFVSIFVYILWDKLGLSIEQRDYLFFTGNSFVFFLLCLFIYIKNSQYVISFLLFSISLNNFIDELVFDNTKMGINEWIFLSITIIIAIKYYAGKTTRPPNRNIFVLFEDYISRYSRRRD